jgi:4-hydroxy-2-oxoheptanedioate aldolase
MGKTPQMDCDDPEFIDALNRIRTAAIRHGVAPGIHVADAATASRRISEGWKFIAISSELGMMNQAAAQITSQLKLAPAKEIARY